MRADVVVCGAGLAGLAAGHALARAGRGVLVLEREAQVGGLARTLVHRGQRFDLGGHRLLTDRARVAALVREVVHEPLRRVPRSSQILLGGRRVDYPLRALNAVAGLGPGATLRILQGYLAARLARGSRRRLVSLEDWVVRHYGWPLFEMFFRPYSEKVWGIACERISADWVAQRIQGLSLGAAIRRSLARPSGAGPRTLAAEFLYPERGIGAIADGLREALARSADIRTASPVTRLVHRAGRIEQVQWRRDGRAESCHAEQCVSSLPLPVLAHRLWPPPPVAVLAAAARLRYRDLLLVTVRLARERVTDQSWIYVPDRGFALGRVHEPKNWSARMGAPGATLLVAEHFCQRSDPLWRTSDERLLDQAAGELAALGLIRRDDVRDGLVVRVPSAYPVFDIGYAEARRTITDYLAAFDNLHIVGRTGAFRYDNMDQALESGLEAADAVLARGAAPPRAFARTGTDA